MSPSPRKYIVSHDVGSAGDKAVLTDIQGKIIASCYTPYSMIYPAPGLSEQDPDMLWKTVVRTTKKLIRDTGVEPSEVVGIGIGAQMFDLIPVDENFKPLTNMITWMDLRAVEQSERLLHEVGGDRLYEWTGNIPRAKDTIPKILWLKETRPELWRRTFKLIDCKEYILYQLTGKCVIDWHGASVFMLFDPKTKKWSSKACAALGIPLEMLPETHPCLDIIGGVLPKPAKAMGINPGTPVVICAGDVGVAQVGAGTITEGMANLYIGTGGWIAVSSMQLINNPAQPFWALNHVDPDRWIMSADLDTAGGSFMWFRDRICNEEIKEARKQKISAYELLTRNATTVEPGAGKLLFYPWLSGERGHLGIEHYARGAFVGLAFNHTKAHMARAILEGVAFYYRWMIEEMEQTGLEIKAINAIGGGCTSQTWIQIMCDITERNLQVVEWPHEAGSIGAALTVAVGLGYYPDLDSVEPLVRINRIVEPRIDGNNMLYDGLYREYVSIGKGLIPGFAQLSKFH